MRSHKVHCRIEDSDLDQAQYIKCYFQEIAAHSGPAMCSWRFWSARKIAEPEIYIWGIESEVLELLMWSGR